MVQGHHPIKVRIVLIQVYVGRLGRSAVAPGSPTKSRTGSSSDGSGRNVHATATKASAASSTRGPSCFRSPCRNNRAGDSSPTMGSTPASRLGRPAGSPAHSGSGPLRWVERSRPEPEDPAAPRPGGALMHRSPFSPSVCGDPASPRVDQLTRAPAVRTSTSV